MAERKKKGEGSCAKTVKFLKPQMERARLLDKESRTLGLSGEPNPLSPRTGAENDPEMTEVKGIIKDYAELRNSQLAGSRAAPGILSPAEIISPTGLLRGLNSPMDLHFMSVEQLNQLAGDVRRLIIETVAPASCSAVPACSWYGPVGSSTTCNCSGCAPCLAHQPNSA